MKVGFIGLAITGRPMAANPLNAGHALLARAARGGKACDHSALVRALEALAAHDIGGKR